MLIVNLPILMSIMGLYLFYIIVLSVFSIEKLITIHREYNKTKDKYTKEIFQYWYFIIFYIWITMGTIGYYVINQKQ